MTTTTTEVPTVINLAPLINMRPVAEQLVERMVTGQHPAEHEVNTFLTEARRRGARVVDTLLLNVVDMHDRIGSTWVNNITNELTTVVDLLSGAHEVGVTWDEYATPERAAQRAAMIYARIVGAGVLSEEETAAMLTDDGLEVDVDVRVRHRLTDDVVIATAPGVEVEKRVVRD